MKKRSVFSNLFGCLLLVSALCCCQPNRTQFWYGDSARKEFAVAGQNCQLYVPETPAPGRPWVWRTEFLGEFPQVDSVLLTKGYHVAYINVQNMYGAPKAMILMDSLYDYLTHHEELSRKPTLEGFSRGGLFALNWAYEHPDRVSSLYLDAPVCDFKSWPGGTGSGPGSPTDWQNLLKVYQFTSAEALSYKGNPIDKIRTLAIADTPILSVCGGKDTLVPMRENTNLLAARYRRFGGRKFKVITKRDGGHHPHSLPNPAPIVAFIERYQH